MCNKLSRYGMDKNIVTDRHRWEIISRFTFLHNIILQCFSDKKPLLVILAENLLRASKRQ